MRTLKDIHYNEMKPISKEALAICAGTVEKGLEKKIRSDSSFDVIIVSNSNPDNMNVELCKYNGNIPLYDTYCGHALQKALEKLPYALDYTFPASFRWKNHCKSLL